MQMQNSFTGNTGQYMVPDPEDKKEKSPEIITEDKTDKQILKLLKKITDEELKTLQANVTNLRDLTQSLVVQMILLLEAQKSFKHSTDSRVSDRASSNWTIALNNIAMYSKVLGNHFSEVKKILEINK